MWGVFSVSVLSSFELLFFCVWGGESVASKKGVDCLEGLADELGICFCGVDKPTEDITKELGCE